MSEVKQDYRIYLDTDQRAALLRAVNKGARVFPVTLPADKLMNNGSDLVVKLSIRQIRKLTAAHNDRTAATIVLPMATMDELAGVIAKEMGVTVVRKGGFLPQLAMAVAAPAINSIVGRLTKPADPETDPAMRRLKYLRGQGVEAMENYNFMKGMDAAAEYLDDPAVKKLVESGDQPTKKEFEEVVGSGLVGGASGWDSFWSGFKMMFTDPLSGLELLGREIKNAFTPKKKAGAGLNVHQPLTHASGASASSQ